jgi:DNA primase
MNLLDLAEEMGLEPHKTSSSKGGEYHCPCPQCGGKDRFMFWLSQDRYWCRQCNAGGDSIQFCRDFQRLSFQEACIKTKKNATNCKQQSKTLLKVSLLIRSPSCVWIDKANSFIESSHQRLLIDTTAMKYLNDRSLDLETIRQNKLGWNPAGSFYRRSDWGIEENKKKIWIYLPKGIVIPVFENNIISKIKIRKSEWTEGDLYGKYYEIPGSSNILPLYGNLSLPILIIVEAEFDAMLIVQEAHDLCNCLALGGAQKKPDEALFQWLLNRKLILYALDFDEAGKKAYSYWQQSFSNLEPWPTPEEKSPGNYSKAGGNIKNWILAGIQQYSKEFMEAYE